MQLPYKYPNCEYGCIDQYKSLKNGTFLYFAKERRSFIISTLALKSVLFVSTEFGFQDKEE